MPLYSFNYSIPYLILGSIFCCCGFGEYLCRNREKYKKFFCYLSIFSYWFFFAGRGFIGWDWIEYVELFLATPDLLNFYFSEFSFKVNETSVDPGFILAISASKVFITDYLLFICFWTTIDVIAFYLFFRKYSVNISFSLLLLIAFNMALQVDLLRNIKALIFIVLSLQYIQKRKLIPFLLCIAISSLFHLSSIIFLPSYWFLHKQYSKAMIIPIFIFANLYYLLQVSWLTQFLTFVNISSRYQNYIDNAIGHGITGGYIFYTLVFLVGLYVKCSKDKEESEKILIFKNAFLCYYLIFLLFQQFDVIATRLTTIFSFSLWILCPYYCYTLSFIRKKVIFLCFVLGICWIKLKAQNATGNIVYYYDNFFIGDQISFSDRVFNRIHDGNSILHENRKQ